MLSEAIAYPTADDEWTERVLVGGVLVLTSPLLLPAIALQGYLVRVIRSVAAGEAVAPEFDDWETLFVDGLKVLVVAVGYALVPAVLVAVAFGVAGLGTAFAAASGSNAGVGVGALALVGLAGLTLVVSLVVAYLVPAALVRFAVEGSVGAAFEVRAVLDGALTAEYAAGWALAAVVAVVIGAIGSALAVVLVGFFVSFWGQVVSTHLFATGYLDATGRDRARPA